jgi:putative Ca2+/H+ antiporter (TMEM165/GDT1 family)
MDVTLFGTAFLAVLFAELVGDKLLYGTGALAARFGPSSVMAGAVPALALKSAAAVLLGGLIAQVPHAVIAITTCLAFSLTAYTIGRGTDRDDAVDGVRVAAPGFQRRGAVAGFTAIFFTEWGDPGQLTTAALVASSHAPVTVWLAASAAMATKAVIALSLGSVVHRHVPQRLVRWAGVSLGVVLAISAAFGFR